MKKAIINQFVLLVFCCAVSLSTFAQTNQMPAMPGQVKTADAVTNSKTPSVIRVGLANVKTGTVGAEMNPAELAGAVQNSLAEYLKSPNIELVALESKLASAIDAEAKQKECAFVIYANVSHKKGGGGGFGGMFKAIAPVMSSVVPMAGGMGGAIAGQVMSTVVTTAANATANVKAKDEITLDVEVNSSNGGAAIVAKQFKAKAKSGGEDIISPMIEQAAQLILDAVTK